MANPYEVFEESHADAKRQAEIQKEEERFHAEIEDAWKWVLDDPRGLLLMWFVLSRCGSLASSFNTQSTVMAFNEGRRSIGNFILNSMLSTDSAALVRMIKRYDDARRDREQRDE